MFLQLMTKRVCIKLLLVKAHSGRKEKKSCMRLDADAALKRKTLGAGANVDMKCRGSYESCLLSHESF